MTDVAPISLPLSLGRQIAEARRKMRLDQDEFGERYDVNRTTISRWERDTHVPPFDVMVRISEDSGWPLELFARAIPVPTSTDPEGGSGLRRSRPAWNEGVVDLAARRATSRTHPRRPRPLPRTKVA